MLTVFHQSFFLQSFEHTMKSNKFTDNIVFTDDESSVHTSEDNKYFKQSPTVQIHNVNDFLIFDPTKANNNNPKLSQQSVEHKSYHRQRFNKYHNTRSKVLYVLQ